MSLTTRCPACATTFRVVPDQLKLSDGWVRCGHCADVFDATRYLENWSSPEPGQIDPAAAATDQNPVLPPRGVGAPAEPEPVVQDAWSAPGLTIDPTPPAASPSTHARTDDPADAGLGDMPIVNRPEVLLDVAPDGLSDGVPEVSPVSEPVAPEPEVRVEAFAPAPAPDIPASFEPTDLVPLPGDEPPARSHRDELDRLLDRMLEEEAGSERAEDVTDALQAGADTTSKPAPRFSAVPVPVAAADEADFQTELQRYASRLKKPAAPPPVDAPDLATSAVPLAQPTPSNNESPDDAEAPDDATNGEPEFVRQARRRAFWQSPGVRAVLVVLVLLLSALLAGQWAVHERDRLAASQPQLLPWLDRLCESLGCRVSPVRDIDAIVIDSSTLVRRLGNFYSFDLVLKNTSTLELAVPALELSLTDTGDRVISRRVFLPEELPGVPPLLPAQASVPVSLRLSLAVGDQLPMAGYRALIFYP